MSNTNTTSGNSSACRVIESRISLTSYPTISKSSLPPVFDDDNVYPFSIYPYSQSLRPLNEPELRSYQAVILENERLRVTVIPDLGGRIYQIEDRLTGGLYLHENRCVRPTIIPPRWGFISLGIELNFPYAHSPTGADPVAYELLHDERGGVGVAVGEREMQWGLCWRAEVWLYPDFRGVVVGVRCWNPSETAREVQWWSNCAQPGGGDAEFLFPPEPFVAHIDGEGTGMWPDFNGADLRWHRTFDRMVGVFMEPTKADWFGIYHHAREWGLLHLADPRELPGKKLWSFGSTGSTADWSLSMTRDGDTNVEIQAGIPTLQGQTLNLSPDEELAFTEMWVPVDNRETFADGVRPNYTDCLARTGGAPQVPRVLPSCTPSNFWQLLRKAHDRNDTGFLASNSLRADFNWPPPLPEFEAPLLWAASHNYPRWKNDCAVWFCANQRWDEAKALLEESIALEEINPMALGLLGLVLWRIDKKPEDGWPLIERALEQQPDGYLFEQAEKLLRELGDMQKREAVFAAWNDPIDHRRKETHAAILLDKGDASGCIRYLEETKWPRVHCRYRRTKLWVEARSRLNLPTEPIPDSLKEDPYQVSR